MVEVIVLYQASLFVAKGMLLFVLPWNQNTLFMIQQQCTSFFPHFMWYAEAKQMMCHYSSRRKIAELH